MDERRLEFGFVDEAGLELELESGRERRGSISVAEKERFREGERKEFGEREGRCWLGEG